MPRPDARRGFTLIEVLVALTIGSAVVLMVHQAFGVSADTVERLDTARIAHRRSMRAQAELVAAFGSLEVGIPGAAAFAGDPARVRFSSRQRAHDATSAGDFAMIATTVTIRDGWLRLERDGAPDSLLAAESLTLDYLMAFGADASWVQSWHSPASAPLAVRMRLARGAVTDTFLYVIGPRG